ncbi:MAG: glycosyltransferase family 4 protein [Phenylobacterium sp.]|uniref:glycosyltransferase family 4 protein n=1 Tax=Phenylobacterium sp. TaxID=1871053 RepID=UPI00391D14B0
MSDRRFTVDFTLGLINRTGAYYLARDIVRELGDRFAGVRYWRLFLKAPPEGLPRKVLARAALWELGRPRLNLPPWPRRPDRSDGPMLFLDPLYVMHTELRGEDIVLCHDVCPLTHPQFYAAGAVVSYEAAYARIAAARPGMVFVSQASKDAFVELFGEDFRFLEVIPLYVRVQSREGDARAPSGVRPPFLLTVGAYDGRKNQERSIRAFAASGLHERGWSYVLCGPLTDSAPKGTGGVVGLGYVDDAELRWLYRNASGFVLPSLAEGFGMPALEAAQQGLVPIVSRGGALEEAIGGAGLLVDPEDVEAIADAMRSVADMDPAAREAILARAAAHAALLSPERFIARWAARIDAG